MDRAGLLRHWRFRVHRVQVGHYEAGRIFELRHFWLGVPAVVMSTIVGTAVFASLGRFADEEAMLLPKIAVGLLSVTAAVLVSLQTFLRYAEQAGSHKTAGAKYAHIKHRLEMLAAMPPETDADLKAELDAIEAEWNQIREESPNLPTFIWRHVEQTITLDDDSGADSEFNGK